MNEKIRELRQQATIIVGAESGFAFDREVLDEQKFAELIIRECANFIKEWERYQLDMADQCNGHFPTGGAGELKKHFGVEL